ncbi:MAG: Rpn family recombination-promoting nuclease/putative transposase [Chloroherpetonaceae bacterium]
MKTDNLFYHIFSDLPEAFFALIGLPESEAREYVFQSVELKQTAFRIDATFQPKDEERPMYFVEVQFQRDRKFYCRFFAETFLYLHQHEVQDWRGVVIFPSKKIEPSFKNYEELIESGRVKRIYLEELPKTERLSPQLEIFRLMIADEQETLKTVRAILSETGTQFWEILEKILVSKFSNLTREEIEKMLKLETNLMKTRYYREAREEAIREGLEDGKRQTAEEIAKKMLEENLPADIVIKITGLSKRKVQQLRSNKLTSKQAKANDRPREKQNSSALKTRRRNS